MSISVMKQALEALEFAAGLTFASITKNCQCQICLAHTALRQAIAEAEKQEPVAFVSGYTNGECVVMPMNRATVFSVGTAFYTAPVHASDISAERVDETAKYRHEWGLVTDDALIEEVRRRGFTIRDAQISPKIKDEYELCCQKYDTCTEPCTPRGRHLAKREWVGLTDEELRDALHTCPHDTVENLRVRWLYAKEFARAIEAAHGIGEQK